MRHKTDSWKRSGNVPVSLFMPARAKPTAAPPPPVQAENIDWEVVDDISDSEANIKRWAQLYKTAKRIRRLQTYFAYIGKQLQTIDPKLRERLIKLWPAGTQ